MSLSSPRLLPALLLGCGCGVLLFATPPDLNTQWKAAFDRMEHAAKAWEKNARDAMALLRESQATTDQCLEKLTGSSIVVPVHQWRVFTVDGKPRWCDDSTMVCNAEGQGPERAEGKR